MQPLLSAFISRKEVSINLFKNSHTSNWAPIKKGDKSHCLQERLWKLLAGTSNAKRCGQVPAEVYEMLKYPVLFFNHFEREHGAQAFNRIGVLSPTHLPVTSVVVSLLHFPILLCPQLWPCPRPCFQLSRQLLAHFSKLIPSEIHCSCNSRAPRASGAFCYHCLNAVLSCSGPFTALFTPSSMQATPQGPENKVSFSEGSCPEQCFHHPGHPSNTHPPAIFPT